MSSKKEVEKLRELAENRLAERESLHKRSADESQRLLQELSIHQEELKIQNEELQNIRKELEISKAKYFELYDLAPVGYITLSHDLFIKESNLAAATLLGVERKDLIDKPLSKFVTPGSYESLYLHFRRLSKGNGEQRHTFVLHRNDGSELQIQFDSNRIDDIVGKGFKSIMVDITELRDAQKKQKKYGEDLERSNTDLMQFAYVASHDLQEPLRMVTAYLSLLERRYRDKLDPKGLEYIRIAVDGGARMRELINDLLEYSRLEMQGKSLEPVAMNIVVTKALAGLRTVIDENQPEIIVGALPTIDAHENQMIQLMQNLIGNAIKFHGPERPTIRISASEGTDDWVFSVKDNGIGLNKIYSDKIFQLFQRLNSEKKYPGSGIGLAIAKRIVERNGGRIWVESEEGKGATFFFTVLKVRKGK